MKHARKGHKKDFYRNIRSTISSQFASILASIADALSARLTILLPAFRTILKNKTIYLLSSLRVIVGQSHVTTHFDLRDVVCQRLAL